MRNKILYLVISVLLASSCSREKRVPVIIHPLQIDLNGDIEGLRQQLYNRSASLAYEDSYEGVDRGVKLFYLNDDNDGMHYYFQIFTVMDRIQGINASISSSQMSPARLYRKVEKDILPDFQESTTELKDAMVIAERKMSEDVRGKAYYYRFEIKTKELQEKLK